MTVEVSSEVPSPITTAPARDDPAWLHYVVGHWRAWLPYVLAVAIYGLAVWISPSYADMRQLGTLLVLASMLGIVAIGQTLVMLIGGIDLSVSAVITFVNLVVAATVAGNDGRIWLAVVLAVLIGLVVGLVNGVLIHVLRLPDIIMTLASFTILTGVALLYSGGSPKGSGSPLLGTLANGRLWRFLPYSMILWVVLSAIVIFALRRTAPGRRVYAVGLEPHGEPLRRGASRLDGDRVVRGVGRVRGDRRGSHHRLHRIELLRQRGQISTRLGRRRRRRGHVDLRRTRRLRRDHRWCV